MGESAKGLRGKAAEPVVIWDAFDGLVSSYRAWPDPSGAPRLAREVGVVLSCDHRVLDGVRALAFLNDIRAALEAPEALFD